MNRDLRVPTPPNTSSYISKASSQWHGSLVFCKDNSEVMWRALNSLSAVYFDVYPELGYLFDKNRSELVLFSYASTKAGEFLLGV